MHLLRVTAGGRRLLQAGASNASNTRLGPQQQQGDGLLGSLVTSAPLVVSEPSLMQHTNSSSNTTGGFFMDGDDDDAAYSDMQTVALACVLTLVPLFIILVVAFGVRIAWRKHRQRLDGSPGSARGVLRRDESSEPNAAKSVASTGHLLPDELKTSESQFTVTPVEVEELVEEVAPHTPLLSLGTSSTSHTGHATSTPGNHTSAKSANGSIITLTMQNNHLIVETENMGGEDGEDALLMADAISADSLELSGPSSQQAQIHDPPPQARSPSPPCHTGLAQSQDSLESPSYRYGTQTGYSSSGLGYADYLGYTGVSLPLPPRLSSFSGTHTKWRPPLSYQRSQRSTDDSCSFAPSHHRSASLPLRRNQSLQVESPAPSISPVAESSEVATRGSGKYRARQSLPLITPAPGLLSRLQGGQAGPSIAE